MRIVTTRARTQDLGKTIARCSTKYFFCSVFLLWALLVGRSCFAMCLSQRAPTGSWGGNEFRSFPPKVVCCKRRIRLPVARRAPGGENVHVLGSAIRLEGKSEIPEPSHVCVLPDLSETYRYWPETCACSPPGALRAQGSRKSIQIGPISLFVKGKPRCVCVVASKVLLLGKLGDSKNMQLPAGVLEGPITEIPEKTRSCGKRPCSGQARHITG